jgi:hypothetical protein
MDTNIDDSFTSAEYSQNDKLDALDELFYNSAIYHSSQKYLDLLKFINKFPKLSPYNAYLVQMQNSGVTVVNTPGQWRKLGRYVKFQARPLVILVPFGPVQFVYDIADTEGDPLPEYFISPFATMGYLDNDRYYRTIENTRKVGIEVKEYDMHKNSAGYAEYKNNKFSISLNSTFSLNDKFSTLIHELAHIYCGHLGTDKNSWWNYRRGLSRSVCEIEAESISYIICNRIGLETTSVQYLSSYIEDHSSLPNISLNTILLVSGYIEQMGTKTFKQKNRSK